MTDNGVRARFERAVAKSLTDRDEIYRTVRAGRQSSTMLRLRLNHYSNVHKKILSIGYDRGNPRARRNN